MMLHNWDNDEVHRALSQFEANTLNLYILRHCINIAFVLHTNKVNISTF
jgi:hypothetical protein